MILNLDGFGPLNQNETYAWGPGIHRKYVIHYIKKGRGFFETDGKRYALKAGESFFLAPGQTVKYYPDPADPWKYLWVDFQGYGARDLVAMTAFPEYPVCPQSQFFAAVYEKFSRDTKYRHAQLYNDGLLQVLLAEYIRVYPAGKEKRAFDHMYYARRCVDTGYCRHDFGVEELAQAVGVERSHLYRMFMEAEGVSPKQYIINIRMENALQMMQNGISSIKLISHSVGYEDPQYFSNAFRKKFGLSPKNYMKL